MTSESGQTGIAYQTALVVDDDPFILELIWEALNSCGVASIEKSSDAAQALERVWKQDVAFDLVVCDLNMPGVDGMEFLRYLSSSPFDGSVVLVSGEHERVLSTAQSLAQAHGLKVLGSLEKPVSFKAFEVILARGQELRQDQNAKGNSDFKAEDIRTGLDNDEFFMEFQPKICLSTGQMVGVEALVRWMHPERGLVPPSEFVEIIENQEFVDEVTGVILSKAISEAGQWYLAGLNIKVSINVSAQALRRLDLPERIVSWANQWGFPLENLILEVTESQLMSDITSALEILGRLRLKRIGVSIDDFGTGYSTFEQLKRIPFTELKIDKSFVSGSAHNMAAKAILESNVVLARKLDMSIVAEGVETREDWDLVASLGIDMVQGFIVSGPLPADQVLEWAQNFHLANHDLAVIPTKQAV